MTTENRRSRVVAVIVSYNRQELLAEALRAVDAQSRPVDALVVIDNASTDDSVAVARRVSPQADVIALERNVGGAGGFAVGLAAALQDHGAEYVWLMDDDTIPTPGALASLLAGAARESAVVAASRVVWTDGSDHPMNTPRRHPFQRRRTGGAVPVRSSSFVSMLVRASAVRAEGLPIADYFIWNDDFEYSTRLIRSRRGVYVPDSVVEHRTKRLVSTDDDPGDRFYFEVRNKLWMYRLSRSLAPGEKAVYGASTAVRWVRTFRRSQDRRTLARALRAGVRDGSRTRPRPNSEVMRDLPRAEGLVKAFES
ncbi:glycosyltransferase [Herbiconiux sp. SYSU D00978]|uniref:glycosyltransferase n=1 Tax=Herbiconiux sp. SYSU D00978 TaxID=2812562 RepID=UPI001A95BA76|nr:glycosyltransferase [Herbiconiux sp. SYSU D00978]